MLRMLHVGLFDWWSSYVYFASYIALREWRFNCVDWVWGVDFSCHDWRIFASTPIATIATLYFIWPFAAIPGHWIVNGAGWARLHSNKKVGLYQRKAFQITSWQIYLEDASAVLMALVKRVRVVWVYVIAIAFTNTETGRFYRLFKISRFVFSFGRPLY